MIRWLTAPVAAVLIAAVRGYQYAIRPLLPPTCRFVPGCSEYFILAVKKYGPVRGAVKGVWRVCRCHPYGGSGYDPP
ncbi:MAG: membrane protein insertion efficiency factor YidD [Fimbriiglobus sp.]